MCTRSVSVCLVLKKVVYICFITVSSFMSFSKNARNLANLLFVALSCLISCPTC